MSTEAPAQDKPKLGADTPLQRLAAEPDKATAKDIIDATDWFLNPDAEEVAADYVELNVGGNSERRPPKWVRFEVQVLARDRISAIRKESTRGKGESAETDGNEANLKIATEGLLNPDLSKEENRVVRGQRFLSAEDALVARFAHKPGLIDQLAGAVVELSGYDDDDRREVRAAGN